MTFLADESTWHIPNTITMLLLAGTGVYPTAIRLSRCCKTQTCSQLRSKNVNHCYTTNASDVALKSKFAAIRKRAVYRSGAPPSINLIKDFGIDTSNTPIVVARMLPG
jgi:hypothetical protein